MQATVKCSVSFIIEYNNFVFKDPLCVNLSFAMIEVSRYIISRSLAAIESLN